MTNTELIARAHDDLFRALPAVFTDEDRALVAKAYALASDAHGGQTRKSGLPYILHPLAVALIIVTEMRQTDVSMVCAALLHDVVEDNKNYTIEYIETEFGKDVAKLVAAVTKPNKEQVDNFQHILRSVKGDIRVLILKLSDRLHNMRTLESMRPQKQWKTASETRFFYAPLAGRLGLYKIKSEMENLAFQFLNPTGYEQICKLIEEDRERTRSATESFMYDCLHKVGEIFGGAVGFDIRYRKPYSIWREMQELGCDFYHVPFKHYIRAVYSMDDIAQETGWSNWDFSEEQVAMLIYSSLTSKYRESGSLVNYMAQPKANGYRSVHFRLVNPKGGIEELHVSSEDMREQSYWGCIVESKEQWMKRLTSLLDELAKDPESLMPGIRDSLYNEDVVAFTPKARSVSLPKGATVLDFAYEVHTDIGDHAKCARVNGKLESIRTVLQRGDTVEIVTDEDTHPTKDWLSSAVTYRAKKHIRSYLSRQPKPVYNLCPHCHPLPGSEIIGFKDADTHVVTIHARHCPAAIRNASEKGNTIVAVEDFLPDPAVLYPIKVKITGIDRYHLLQDILDCIVEDFHLSMKGLTTHTKDNIVSCVIEFSVHSATERNAAISKISRISGVEELNFE